MTISNPNQATHPLPDRCWDFTPDLLRKLGGGDDFDLETHALGERDWDARTGAQYAIDHDLDDKAKDALFLALARRRQAVWGKYAPA